MEHCGDWKPIYCVGDLSSNNYSNPNQLLALQILKESGGLAFAPADRLNAYSNSVIHNLVKGGIGLDQPPLHHPLVGTTEITLRIGSRIDVA